MSAASRPPLGAVSRPDPGPPVLRLAPAPSTEPPADGPDWSGGAAHGGGQGPARQGGTLPHGDPPDGRALPGGDGGELYVQGSLAVDLRHEAYDSFFGPQATGTELLPEADAWARRIITAVLEACDGTRSADQLTRWLAPEVRERVARRGQLARRRARRPHRPPRVRALLSCHPADGVCEVSAVVQSEGRVRALALRMSGVDGRWLVTALELG